MIEVLVVDDSVVESDLLVYILRSDNEINVCGIVKNGKEAIDFVQRYKPDVITMDVNMPVMDGIKATKIIMEKNPVPIIMVSTYWDPKDINDSFKALQIGAVAIAEKPMGLDNPRFNEIAQELIQHVKLMSEIKVVKRIHSYKTKVFLNSVNTDIENREIKIVCIGASTGGPVVIEKILSGVSSDFAYPILIVQHIMPGFAEGFAEWLLTTSRLAVKIAKQGEIVEKGVCYIAPDLFHLTISSEGKIILVDKPPVNGIRPAVSYLFSSAAKAYGKKCLPILLSGMGKDGASELKELRDSGAVTIVQDKESAVINGMPGEAVKLNAATHIYSPDDIIYYLNTLSNRIVN
jgi:two-component system, chemotaxis family, protein-glutamate methylesterase/glutaminase